MQRTHDPSAVAAALRTPTGVYNVADDEPLTRREAAAVVAEAVGVRRVHFGPVLAYKALPSKAAALSRSLRVSNRRFREATGCKPAHPSIREGWPTVVAR
jgi:nucleoside-diphosphate-sugar epimerase